jgi:hypothetical protein
LAGVNNAFSATVWLRCLVDPQVMTPGKLTRLPLEAVLTGAEQRAHVVELFIPLSNHIPRR